VLCYLEVRLMLILLVVILLLVVVVVVVRGAWRFVGVVVLHSRLGQGGRPWPKGNCR
jgi:hypothetical protein